MNRFGRREVLSLGAGAFLVAMVPFAGRGRRLVRRRVPLMGTLAEFAVVHVNERRAHEAIDLALEEMRVVDRTMSRFRADSDVGRANREAALSPVQVEEATARVLGEALLWAEATGGAFDPCLGKAVELWDVTHRREPPPAVAVRCLAGRRLHRSLDLTGRRVRFADPDVAIDLGGIGKGYAVDRAVDALRLKGVGSALVNLGGDLYALGESEDGDPWHVGVRSATDPSRCDATLDVRDQAVATSGDYLSYFRYGGRRYHHLLDPRTGAPRDGGRRSLTVAAPTCLVADAAATALFGSDVPGVLRRFDARIVASA